MITILQIVIAVNREDGRQLRAPKVKCPELGLGFDPIFDAQDYPDIGYRIKSFDSKTGIVQLESSDNLGYHAKVRVKLIGNKTLVDGAGVIRMVAH